jgi:hypothetical protein
VVDLFVIAVVGVLDDVGILVQNSYHSKFPDRDDQGFFIVNRGTGNTVSAVSPVNDILVFENLFRCR